MYLSGTERENLIDALSSYIHMLSVMSEITGSAEYDQILTQLDDDLRPIFYKLYKGYNIRTCYSPHKTNQQE